MTDADADAECECPMLYCRGLSFANARDMITHLKTCEHLYGGEFGCPLCPEVNRYSTESRRECSWTNSKTPMQRKFSRLADRLTQSSGKTKNTPDQASSNQSESVISWIRSEHQSPDPNPFNPAEVGRRRPSSSLDGMAYSDVAPWAPNSQAPPFKYYRESIPHACDIFEA